MKIIATITECPRRYIAEVSADEIATIARGDPYAKIADENLRVGTRIEVRQQWSRVAEIAAAQGQLDAAQKQLRAVADLIGAIDVVVTPPIEEVKP